MTKEQLAEKLNGREYGNEITGAEEREAKAAGLVVVFGYSDDNIELRGAISDEAGCWNGAVIKLHSRGILADHEERCECSFCGYESSAKKCATIAALWGEEPGYSFTYKTNLPHATFDVLEDGDKYCRGIVFDLKSLPIVNL